MHAEYTQPGPDVDILVEMHGRFNPVTAVEMVREMAPHNVGGPVSTAAALHLAACTPNFKIQEHLPGFARSNDFSEAYVKEAAPGLPEVVDGYFALPAGPGLGVKLDEEVIRQHPRQQIHFNLFAEDWHKRQATKN